MRHARLEGPLYVSGPMSYYPESNIPAFCDACVMLRNMGYEVHSPHEVNIGSTKEMSAEEKWQAFMRADIALLLKCKTVVCLPDWEFSRGAQLEVHIGSALKMRIIPLSLALQTELA